MKATTLNFIVMTTIVTLSAVHSVAEQAQENNEKLIHYSVRNLGTLGGVLGSSAHSINDQGRVGGVANLTGDTEEHAGFWQDGDVTDLGTLGGDNSNVDFPVKNTDDLVVGFAQTPEIDPLGESFCIFLCTPSGACNGSNQTCRGFRWRNGLMEPLGTLGGNNSAATEQIITDWLWGSRKTLHRIQTASLRKCSTTKLCFGVETPSMSCPQSLAMR